MCYLDGLPYASNLSHFTGLAHVTVITELTDWALRDLERMVAQAINAKAVRQSLGFGACSKLSLASATVLCNPQQLYRDKHPNSVPKSTPNSMASVSEAIEKALMVPVKDSDQGDQGKGDPHCNET